MARPLRKQNDRKTRILKDFDVLKLKEVQANHHGYAYTCFVVEGRDGARIRKKFKDEAQARSFAISNVERVSNRQELRKAFSTHFAKIIPFRKGKAE